MIKGYKDFKTQPMFNGPQKLPAGVYIARVFDVQPEVNEKVNQLILQFEICEGDYKGFFDKDWKNQMKGSENWRGVYRMWLVKNDNSDADKKTKDIFERSIWAFEQSNAGFHFKQDHNGDWDENQLKGLFVGVKFRNRQYNINGNRGFTTECCGLADIPSVRAGKVKTPKDKLLDEKPAAPIADNSGFTDVDDSELPF
jgi:hypothetical protein